jgi:hypothetical protein
MNGNRAVIIMYLTTAIVMLAIAGTVTSVFVVVHPLNAANTQPLLISGAILAFLTPTITSLIGVIKGYQNSADIKTLTDKTDVMSTKVDGQMTNLIEKTAQAATLAERAAGDKTAAAVLVATTAASVVAAMKEHSDVPTNQ